MLTELGFDQGEVHDAICAAVQTFKVCTHHVSVTLICLFFSWFDFTWDHFDANSCNLEAYCRVWRHEGAQAEAVILRDGCTAQGSALFERHVDSRRCGDVEILSIEGAPE